MHSWASCQIRKIAGCACTRNAGNVFPGTAGKRFRHASWHVRAARDMMHAGMANQWFPFEVDGGENVPGIPGECASRNITYLARGPWYTTYACGCPTLLIDWHRSTAGLCPSHQTKVRQCSSPYQQYPQVSFHVWVRLMEGKRQSLLQNGIMCKLTKRKCYTP